MKGPTTLREVRLWHWRKVVTHRHNARDFEARAEAWEAEHGVPCRHLRSKARQNHGVADWHLTAVQALNEFVPGTAEQDDNIEKAGKNVYCPRF